MGEGLDVMGTGAFGEAEKRGLGRLVLAKTSDLDVFFTRVTTHIKSLHEEWKGGGSHSYPCFTHNVDIIPI